MTKALTLRGMATVDAVRRFIEHRQPIVLQPLPADGEVPPRWQLVVFATPMPKHKAPSEKRRDARRRRRPWLQQSDGAPA